MSQPTYCLRCNYSDFRKDPVMPDAFECRNCKAIHETIKHCTVITEGMFNRKESRWRFYYDYRNRLILTAVYRIDTLCGTGAGMPELQTPSWGMEGRDALAAFHSAYTDACRWLEEQKPALPARRTFTEAEIAEECERA